MSEPLSADRLQEQRAELIKLHEYDELIFGGFICLHCTPGNCDDPDDNVYWPCQPLREVGVTDHEAVALIKAQRAEIEHKAAVTRVKDLLAEVDRLKAENERLTEERDLAVAHDRQPYPTQWAYDQACKALHKNEERADQAETERDTFRDALIRLQSVVEDEQPEHIATVMRDTLRLFAEHALLEEPPAGGER